MVRTHGTNSRKVSSFKPARGFGTHHFFLGAWVTNITEVNMMNSIEKIEKKIKGMTDKQRHEYLKKVTNGGSSAVVRIVATRKSDGAVSELKISPHQVSQLYELLEICDDRCGDLKLNRIDLSGLHDIFSHLEHDILNDGKVFELTDKGPKLREQRHYLIKKPNWVRKREVRRN